MSHLHPTRQPVKPHECALAVGIPLTREQFIEDLSRPDLKDFASHVRRENLQPDVSNEYYWGRYEGSVRVARRVCEEVKALGVTVCLTVTPGELTELLRNFKVVTFVTHWRFTRLLPEDLIDVDGLLNSLARPASRVQWAVRQALLARDPDVLADTSRWAERATGVRERLTLALSAIAVASHALYRSVADDAPPAEDQYRTDELERLTRVELERAFPNQVAFGKSVEFSDGMRSVQDVVDAVPVGFNGTFDLTSCNSVILGKAIKASHPNCLVAMNRYPTDLYVRMPIYKLAIEYLNENHIPFTEALIRFHTN